MWIKMGSCKKAMVEIGDIIYNCYNLLPALLIGPTFSDTKAFCITLVTLFLSTRKHVEGQQVKEVDLGNDSS